MISNREKGLLHIYRQAAGLSEATYRNVLRQAAGVSSAADRRMNQAGFEAAMAELETMLFSRVDAGAVEDPIGRSKHIFRRDYWRGRLPRRGHITSRQAMMIRTTWARLCEFLPQGECTEAYLHGILGKSVGREVAIEALTAREAACLIDALRDRLAYAIRGAQVIQQESEVPF
jgi:hypothetical protein